MPSVFEKAQKTLNADLLTPESIQDEVKSSLKVRVKPNPLKTFFRITAVLLFGLLLGLFFLDPFIYPIQKTKAMRALVYMNLYGNPADVQELAKSGLFEERELKLLLAKDGDYSKFFPGGVRQARAAGTSAIDYLQESYALRGDTPLEELSFVNRVRRVVFVNIGLLPPQYWNALNPEAEDIHPPLRPGNFFKIEKRDEPTRYTGIGSGE